MSASKGIERGGGRQDPWTWWLPGPAGSIIRLGLLATPPLLFNNNNRVMYAAPEGGVLRSLSVVDEQQRH